MTGSTLALIAFAVLILGYVSIVLAAPVRQPEVSMDSGHEKGSGVRLTRPDGTAVFVNPAAVALVRAPLPGELGQSTVVFASGAKQAVSETVDEVIAAFEEDRPVGGGH